jgi:hypothetical protein
MMASQDRMEHPTLPRAAHSILDLRKLAWHYPLIAVLLLPSVFWIVEDHSIWPWDQAWYAEVTTDLWFWLGRSPSQWIAAMADDMYMKPPGIVWMGQLFVPLKAIFGSVEGALLFSIVLTQIVLLLLMFSIGEELSPNSRAVSAAGVVLAAGAQLFAGLSHQFFVEPLQAVAVAWIYLIAFRASYWPRIRVILHLLAALVIGALAKATTPVYCLLPCVYLVYRTIQDSPERGAGSEWKNRSSVLPFLIVVFLGVPGVFWYLRHLAAVWQHIHDASFGDLALPYGYRQPVYQKLVTWIRLLNASFLAPYLTWVCAAAILLAAVFFLSRGLWSRPKGQPHLHPVAVISGLQLLLTLFIFSLNIAVDTRYMYALLPSIAILFMQICAYLPRQVVVALTAICAIQWGVVNRAALNPAGGLGGQATLLLPVHAEDAQFDELARIVRLTCDTAGRYNIVGIDEPSLNANSASFFSAKSRLAGGNRCYYTSLGYAETDLDRAWRRIPDLVTHYIVTLDEPFQKTPPRFINIVSLPVLKKMRSDSHFIPIPFLSPDGVVIFRFDPALAPVASVAGQSGALSNANHAL